MLYVDQKVRIWSRLDRLGNEVRLSFAEGGRGYGITLAMDADEARRIAGQLVAEAERVESERMAGTPAA